MPESESLAREALQIARANSSSPELSRALVTMGRAQAEQGHYEQATGTLKQALAGNSVRDASELDLIASLHALAAAEYSAGQYEASRSEYERLLTLDRKLHGANHPTVADDLESLGSIQQDSGYYGAAETYARDALAITTTYCGADHPRTAAALTILGRSLLDEKCVAARRLRRAEERFPRVADIYAPSTETSTIWWPSRCRMSPAPNSTSRTAGRPKADSSMCAAFYQDARHGEPQYRYRADQARSSVTARAALQRSGTTDTRRYDNLSRQSNPGISFLQAARTDLTSEYEALGQTQLAQYYRIELAASHKTA